MVIVGDTFHNSRRWRDHRRCVPGQRSSWGSSPRWRSSPTRLPQEVGDFLVLLHSGYSKAQAFAFNVLSSVAMFVGGRARVLRAADRAPVGAAAARGIAAASMIYVSVADPFPACTSGVSWAPPCSRCCLSRAGIATIWLVGSLGAFHRRCLMGANAPRWMGPPGGGTRTPAAPAGTIAAAMTRVLMRHHTEPLQPASLSTRQRSWREGQIKQSRADARSH